MQKAPHIKEEYHSQIHSRVLLHHSWNFIQNKIEPELSSSVPLPSDDYPMINGTYNDQDITVVATRMGIDESLNIVDQLIELGAKNLIKLGSFVALESGIDIGDIYVPEEAVRLLGTIDAILKYGERAVADNSLVDVIKNTASQRKIDISIGGKVVTCPVYGPYIRDEAVDPKYSIDYWRDKCFGDEMECSAVFAVAQAKKAKSAAILVCNRTWAVLDGHRNGQTVDWNEHKNSKRLEYEQGYRNAIKLALDSLASSVVLNGGRSC